MATTIFSHHLFRKTGSFALVTVLVFSFSARPAHAQYVPTNDYFLNAQKALDIGKELGLDGLLNLAAQAAIDQLTQTIISQISGGYGGSPMYITNLDQYYFNLEQRVNQDYAQGLRDAQTCDSSGTSAGAWIDPQTGQPAQSPGSAGDTISDRIAAYLDNGSGTFSQSRAQSVATRYSCPFVDNRPRTLGQDGWDAFRISMTSPGSSPLARQIIVGEELAIERSVARDNAKTRAVLDDGYLPNEECTDGVCHVTTPGSVAKSQVEWSLSSGLRKLELADEIDEMISAVLNAAVERIFTEANGLFSEALSNVQGNLSTSDYYYLRTQLDNNLDSVQSGIQSRITPPR